MSYTGNHLIDGDDGSNPFSPYFNISDIEEQYEECYYCGRTFSVDEICDVAGKCACPGCYAEDKINNA